MNHYPLRICGALVTMAALVSASACGADDGAAAPSTSPTVAASTPSVAATPSPSRSPIKASTTTESIKVTGAYGKEPKVTVKAPFAINKTQARVLEPNKDGTVIQKGGTIEFNYYAVNARTGKTFDNSFQSGKPITFPLGNLVPGFEKGLAGQRKGSRVLLAIPGSDGYDQSGGQADAGIQVGDSLIFVVDVLDASLGAPAGAAVAPKAGLPTVTGALNKPEITVPKTDPPTTLVAQPLIRGEGKKVAATDTITFNYRWVAWKDGRLLEESYSQPAAGSAPLAQLLPGMQKGLVNQTVGSRVLLVIPPAEAYPNGNEKPKVAKGETLVMVVDLLFTAAAQ